MTVHIEFMFSCVLALASVYAASTTQCFEQNIHYIGIGLHKSKNYGPTGSAEGCQSLCQQTDGCDWFNWDGKVDKCWLKTGKGNQSRQKPGGVTGPRICPTTTRKPIITTTTSTNTATASTTPTTTATTPTTTTINHIGTTYCFEENIHYIGHPLNRPGGDNNYGPTGSAEGCQSLCQQTDRCGWFNWEGEEDKCWLKIGKGIQKDKNPGGVTGPRICPGPELLHIGSQYSYYKVPVRPGSVLLSSVIKETCEMHNMTPQCYINNLNLTDSNCIMAPNEKYPSNELAQIICGKSERNLVRCPMLEHTFWYMSGWEAGSAWGVNQGEYERGNDIITSSDNQYFAACLTAGLELLHVGSQYSYYKVPVRPGSALLSSVIKETCEMHGMTPQCFYDISQHTDSNCIMAPTQYPEYPMFIICGIEDPVKCHKLEHTFWYVDGLGNGSAWGVNQGEFIYHGTDIITRSDNQYFAACLIQ